MNALIRLAPFRVQINSLIIQLMSILIIRKRTLIRLTKTFIFLNKLITRTYFYPHKSKRLKTCKLNLISEYKIIKLLPQGMNIKKSHIHCRKASRKIVRRIVEIYNIRIYKNNKEERHKRKKKWLILINKKSNILEVYHVSKIKSVSMS